MAKLEELTKKIPSAPFTAQDAAQRGITYYYLQQLLKEGVIEKFRRGIYQRSKEEWTQEDSFRAALTQLGSPSCICLWSALSYYGLTEEVPSEVWVYVPYGKFSHSSGLKVVRRRNLEWKKGIKEIENFRITSLERTLADAMSDVRHVPKKEAAACLQIALDQKKVRLSSILKMARDLEVYHRIIELVEVVT